MYVYVALMVLISSFIACMRNTETPLIPRQLLFGNASYAGPAISPNGKQLAFLAPYEGVMNVWVRAIDNPDDLRVVTHETTHAVRNYFWSEDSVYLLYLQDNQGNENWNIYRVDLRTNETINLTPFPEVKAGLVQYSPKFPQHLLITMNKEDSRLFDVYKLDIGTGKMELVAKNPGDFIEWSADRDLQIRVARRMNDDGTMTLLYRSTHDTPWRDLVRYDIDVVAQASCCVGFGNKADELYLVDALDNDTARLIVWDLQTGERRVILEDEGYDIPASLLWHPQDNSIVFARTHRAMPDIVVLDQQYAIDFAYIKEQLSGAIHIISYDTAFTRWIIALTRSDLPAEYYFYDRATQKITFLASSRPDLKAYTFAKSEPISFAARDGLTIHGYIAYPTTTTQKSNIPVVLYVHGGPQARDSMDHFDSFVQLCTNRGYACVQLNYRGSIGYGKKFLRMSYKEWGRAMQHDLTDGVAWLINQKIADPKRVAILGGSYGGYASLAGAVFTPDLYCCAVDLCGPSNIITLIESMPPYWQPILAQVSVRIGNKETEQEMLKERSPLFKASDIRIPLLIGQGANDPRVKQAESEQIVAELKKHNIPHEYHLFSDEGHGLTRPENRLCFWAAVEKFLATHVGGRAED